MCFSNIKTQAHNSVRGYKSPQNKQINKRAKAREAHDLLFLDGKLQQKGIRPVSGLFALLNPYLSLLHSAILPHTCLFWKL